MLDAAPAPGQDPEHLVVERIRHLLRLRSWTMAFAIVCTLLPLSFAFAGDRMTFLMFRDVPWSRALWAAAVVLWLWYARLHRRAGTAGF